MVLGSTVLVFLGLLLLSMPIVFALGLAGLFGLWHGGYPMQQIASALVSGSQSWVLLAIPAFVFAGGLMERCGMSHALVEFARALVGWVRGGLGMSVIVVAYFFSDICGSKMAEVSALGSSLMPPLTSAGYKKEDSASLIAAGTAMGMLVPPAIFMIVLGQIYAQGDTPIKEILQLLRDKKCNIPATIELEYEVPKDSDPVKEVAKCLAYAKAAIA